MSRAAPEPPRYDPPADPPARAALLPEGFYDVLPPDAAHEARVVETMMGVLARQGYDRVKPPLVEYEETLLSGVGAGLAQHSFRLMDPMGARMLALRADMTVQVARIARSRLAAEPRPLRLAYAGQVLQVRGTGLRPDRQFAQVGAELIGGPQPAADAEIVLLAVEALASVGIGGLSVDLNEPTLVPALLADAGIGGEAAQLLRHALDRKDAAAVQATGGAAAGILAALLSASGRDATALARLERLAVPAILKPMLDRLVAVAAQVRAIAPDLSLTIDFVEHRGFEYHTGVAFSVFARESRAEVGRGGRYRPGGAAAEDATGFTLYLDTVLRAAPPPAPPRRIYLPYAERAAGPALRDAGDVTVAGLAPEADAGAEARRLGCGWIVRDGAVERMGDA